MKFLNLFKLRAAVIILITCHGCTNQSADNTISNEYRASGSVRTIKLDIADSSWTNVSSTLQMDSYTILSDKIPFGIVKRVLINDHGIYVLDKQSRLICFDFNGNIIFHLNKKGKGPGEFVEIIDMSIDDKNKIIKVLDPWRHKLICFSSITGSYLKEEKIEISALAMAFCNGSNYFYNPYQFNYPNKKELHYSLISTDNKNQIERSLFPHDPYIADYLFDDCYHQFNYNNNLIFYKNRFIDTIYYLDHQQIGPIFFFDLPNALPYEWIKQNPNGLEVSKSYYSQALSDIYLCDGLLYSTFFNNGLVISSFYDLTNEKIIYCGPHIWPIPTKNLPVFSNLSGVFKNRFFSLVSPLIIMERVKDFPEVFPVDWHSINDNSNPVLVFYRVI